MYLKSVNEAVKSDEELEFLSDRVIDFARKYVKGSYGGFDGVGRRFSEALEFAHNLKRNTGLFNEVLANYREIYAILEDENFHTENLGLQALCEPREFMKTVDTIFKGYLRRL